MLFSCSSKVENPTRHFSITNLFPVLSWKCLISQCMPLTVIVNMSYHSLDFSEDRHYPIAEKLTPVCRHVMNTAHSNFLGQSRMDSFLLTLNSTTLKKFGLEWLKMSVVLACVPWKWAKQNYSAHSCAQCTSISIAMKTETVVTGDSGLHLFSSLGFWCSFCSF